MARAPSIICGLAASCAAFGLPSGRRAVTPPGGQPRTECLLRLSPKSPAKVPSPGLRTPNL